ncbi:MAG: hypothetical protein CM1200mP41_16450 [Gammaproteobacteria bacterium]|nr:MAG: hypothetical protein CM1200mP41_16450 [Gammaproteobacteria bacterium]
MAWRQVSEFRWVGWVFDLRFSNDRIAATFARELSVALKSADAPLTR